MTRDEAYKILTSLISNQNLIKHHLACEASMRTIYEYLRNKNHQPIESGEEGKWGLVGLLHDADYELTKEHPQKHTLILEEKIGGKLAEDVIYAIKSHNYKYTKVEPKSLMDWAIVCSDELTGLIIAAALIHPAKKLSAIDTDFVMKRFNEKSFAKGADREPIKLSEEKLGVPLENFITLVLSSMQKIAPALGL